MSDMSFKQAKELTEQLELAEVTLSKTLKNVNKAAQNFENGLSRQEKILKYIPIVDKKLEVMKLIVALNIGFVLGLLAAKFIM